MRVRGFTLIELLAAMAILAVVSVMSVQALGGVFHQRAVLTRFDDRAAPLIRTLALLRQDLAAAAPAPVETDGMQAGILTAPGAIAFHRSGLAALPGVEASGLGTVRWRIDAGRLTRLVTRQVEAADTPVAAQLMLDGVTALTLTPLAQPGTAASTALAPGYEAMLETAQWGTIRLVVAR